MGKLVCIISYTVLLSFVLLQKQKCRKLHNTGPDPAGKFENHAAGRFYRPTVKISQRNPSWIPRRRIPGGVEDCVGGGRLPGGGVSLLLMVFIIDFVFRC
ncbi:hypothetical protein QE152_g16971 [Popillia japonica]|uniref:Uncharacterized protein n=1 Tax=Popillia japonica TaxID=7064 RepID=A0AAW1L291_POPJA